MVMKKYILASSLIILLFLVFGLGFGVGRISQPSIEKVEGLSNKQVGQPSLVDFSLFWDAWHIIEEKYVERDNLDYQQMVYGAINGLLESLDDPYSIFMEPPDSKKFIDDMGGSFEGIGAEVGIRQDVLTIISPLEGMPAQQAGLKAGDKILKVDDTLTADLSLDEAVNLIRGEKGTTVSLLIARDSWSEAKEIKVVRGTIKIPIINWEFKEGKIAYIQFYHFTENSPGEFERVIEEILKEKPAGLVLDVRNNPGGYLEVAIDLASWFLPRGELVVSEDFGNGEKKEYRSRGYGYLEEMPTVVLINEGSASASEILAGALRDIQGIKLVGQQSFGKGSVQQLEKMDDGSSIKITVAKWLTPSGHCINEEGIKPDIEIEISEEDIDQMRDPQLEKALEIIND